MLSRNNVIFIIMLFCSGCSISDESEKEKAENNIAWNFSPSSIVFDIRSDEQLNNEKGQPHTLVLVIVQMKDIIPYYQYISSRDNLDSIISSGNNDTIFNQVKRYVIPPGIKSRLVMDRLPSTRYVAVVAGYLNFSPDKSQKVFNIPVEFSRAGLFWLHKFGRPLPLFVEINLGEHFISDAKILPAESFHRQAIQDNSGNSTQYSSDLIELVNQR
ncbi:type VI secretion lipoprotein TssJ [Kosakonia oryzae]|uniref:type VI secretion lipoprotein TssJ n=1 Tax=Kosakonia oryzae TaxID=497725 RepID=UPI001D080F79|nr:type VI secretion lipoprotein TssJ [Kosakonia oryzae]UDJ82083.1 type VI secretion lipoprotein TssJ [Kosakonia oryzae]